MSPNFYIHVPYFVTLLLKMSFIGVNYESNFYIHVHLICLKSDFVKFDNSSSAEDTFPIYVYCFHKMKIKYRLKQDMAF